MGLIVNLSEIQRTHWGPQIHGALMQKIKIDSVHHPNDGPVSETGVFLSTCSIELDTSKLQIVLTF